MLNKIIQTLTSEECDQIIKTVALGLGYLAVELEDGRVGVSANINHTDENAVPHSCSVFHQAGSLAGSRVGDLVKLAERSDLLSRSIALAAVNAVRTGEGYGRPGDLMAEIDIKGDERVVMVGFIEPIVSMLAKKGCSVSAFEKRALTNRFLKPPEEMPQAFQQADVLILTGTSLINGTLDDLLALETSARLRILMGPSTFMDAAFFAGSGIMHLAGSRVVDGAKALQVVMEGGGTQKLYKTGAMIKVVQEVA